MNKFVILLVILSLTILFGCNSVSDYSELLSKEEGKYAIYLIGDDFNPDLLLRDYNNIDCINGIDNIDRWNYQYPDFKISSTPFMFVFSSKENVLKTDKLADLYEFLKNN